MVYLTLYITRHGTIYLVCAIGANAHLAFPFNPYLRYLGEICCVGNSATVGIRSTARCRGLFCNNYASRYLSIHRTFSPSYLGSSEHAIFSLLPTYALSLSPIVAPFELPAV